MAYLAFFLAACTDRSATAPPGPAAAAPPAATAIRCRASVRGGSVACEAAEPQAGAGRYVIVGGQHTNVELASSNVHYDGSRDFSFDVTVKNLIAQPMATRDGVHADSEGVRVFFAAGPQVTAGTGAAAVASPDGLGTFTATEQPFMGYAGAALGPDSILSPGETSAAKRWHLDVDPTVEEFAFIVFVAAEVPYPAGYLWIEADSIRLGIGGTRTLAAEARNVTGRPRGGPGVSWSTSNAQVASVTAAGVVTGVAAGHAVLRASSGALADSVLVTVVSASPPRIAGLEPPLTGHDSAPELFLPGVLVPAMAAGQVPLRALCVHDDPGGCTLQVFAEPLGGSPTLVASGTDSVKSAHSVVGLAADSIRYRYVATSALGLQATWTSPPVPVEPGARWSTLAVVDGAILDASPDRVLYLNDPLDEYTVLYPVADTGSVWYTETTPIDAWVTPNGWIYEFRFVPFKEHGVRLVGASGLPAGSEAYNATGKGPWVADERFGEVHWMDVTAPAVYQTPFDANDVLTTWSLSYEGSILLVMPVNGKHQVFRARPGVPAAQLSSDTSTTPSAPATDGTGVVYLRTSHQSPTRSQVVYVGGAGEEALTSMHAPTVANPGGPAYLARDGWTVYRTDESGALVTWYRDPSGTRHEISLVGPAAQLVAIGPDGTLVWREGASMYLARAPYTTAVALGRYANPKWWVDGKLYAIADNTFFRIDF